MRMSAEVKPELLSRRADDKRVLVIDDDASILGVIAEVLEDDGYDVVTASSGEEALELLKGDQFAMVMTDIRLPGINGVEVLESVKAASPRTNVIMITSHASLETSIDAIKHGAYDYLLKPFEDLSLISNAAKRAIDSFNHDVERSQLIRSLKVSNQELGRVNHVLHGLAIRDGLTDLFNHRYINEVLQKEIMKAAVQNTDVALIFVDVDKFKLFNDKYGHQNGDVLLRELSAFMRDNVRQKDIVARWGGEEFVIVSPGTNEKIAFRLADSLRAAISEHTFMNGVLQIKNKVTISAGVASLSKQKTKSALIEAADGALYVAKENGRNRVQMTQ
jgi:diguanylate cyclase (GGDEF)-like protein